MSVQAYLAFNGKPLIQNITVRYQFDYSEEVVSHVHKNDTGSHPPLVPVVRV